MVIFFHHLLDEWKREVIPEWAKELGLRGFSKAGHPGVILAEGTLQGTAEFVRRLRECRWQTMELRLEERLRDREGAPLPWRVPTDLGAFHELCVCNGLAPAAAFCEAAGLAKLWEIAQSSPAPAPGRPPDEVVFTWHGLHGVRGLSRDLWERMTYSERRAADERSPAVAAGSQRSLLQLEVGRWERA